MTRTDSNLTKVPGVNENYLAAYTDDHSTDGMDQYRVLPRHKLIQATTSTKLKDQFGEGTIILQPGNVPVWKRGDDPFTFVPVLFFVEWLKWADLRDEKSVLGRTMDPTHEFAKRAKDPERRMEVYDGHEERNENERWHYRYVQTFRFVGVIFDLHHPLHLAPITLSFDRGEFSTGENLINAIKMQKMLVDTGEKDEENNPIVKSYPVPLFAQMLKVEASLRERKDKKWYGLDVIHMEERVPADMIKEMELLHLDYKKAKDAERLLVDESPEDEDPAAVAAESKFG